MDKSAPSRPDIQASTSNIGAFKLPGAASLYEQLDKLVLVCLRDGRNFFGWLRSFDQYANLILDNTVERLTLNGTYADVSIGIFVIRGENVMLLGEVDEEKELKVGESMKQVSEREMRALLAEHTDGNTRKHIANVESAIPEEF